MRQIATLPDDVTARKFTDFLLTLKIATRLLPEGEQIGVWVCDEDKVGQAREELAQFSLYPNDPRYAQAVPAANELRRKENRLEKDYRRKTTRLRDRMDSGATAGDRPLSIALITISVLVSLTSNFGNPSGSAITQALTIAPYATLQGQPVKATVPEVLASGQLWRLVTPIFLHLSILHLLFNSMMLLSLGSQIESVRGTPRFLVLVLALAIFSNLSEYYLSWDIKASPMLRWEENPRFGGLSGVIYGLFGYLWMKSRFFPKMPFRLGTDTVVIMLGWFLLCAVNIVPNVANVAHGAGLLLGVVIGIAPRLWQRRRT